LHTAIVSLHIKERDARDTSDKGSPGTEKPATVADLFANPPDWLTTQLGVYRQDPDRHFKPLCSVVAAAVLGDNLRGEEVVEEVGRLV
jgi:hypothetical protein